MEGIFDILWNGTVIGQVEVLRRGLYYHFTAACIFDENEICRLMIRIQDEVMTAGIMVPENNQFILHKKMAIKQFPDGVPEFYVPSLQGESVASEGLFVPVSEENPFGYLHRLKSAFLTFREGKMGIWIPMK